MPIMRRPVRVGAASDPPFHNPRHRRYAQWAGLLIACLVTVYGNIGSVPALGSPLDFGFSNNKNIASLFRREAESLSDHRTNTLADSRNTAGNSVVPSVDKGTRLTRPSDGVATTSKSSTQEKFPMTVHLGGVPSFPARRKSLFWSTEQDKLSSPIFVGAPDYSGLNYPRNFGRLFLLSSEEDETQLLREKTKQLKQMDQDMDDYYYQFDERTYPRECVRPAWTDLQFPTCNSFHEVRLETTQSDWNVKYLSHGHFRDTFLFANNKGSHGDDVDEFVWKRIRLRDHINMDYLDIDTTRSEALLMERLSASDRITNAYGYCATSVFVEAANELTKDVVPYHEAVQRERGRISLPQLQGLQLQHNVPVFNFNNFTAEEKLDVAIATAEGLAELHGFDSVLVHEDVFADQWMRSKSSGRIMLNDVNNVAFMEWNPEKQEYCKYWMHYTKSDYHAPEEYAGDYVDEQVDVYTMGHVIFSILTGLWPWHEYSPSHEEQTQKLIIAGRKPYINPFYAQNGNLVERRLVSLMNACYKLKPSDRPSIFKVVEYLYETKSMYENHQQQARLAKKNRR